MLASEIILQFLTKVEEGIIEDAATKNQKIPVSSFRIEVEEDSGKFFAAHYMQYLIYGRPPGKQPPPDAMLDFVQKNPDMLDSARRQFKYITEQGLAYIIGRKIAERGTEIWEGKRDGIDLLGVMESNMPQFLKDLASNEAASIATSLRSALK